MKEEILQLVQGGTISSLNYSLEKIKNGLSKFVLDFEQSVKAIEKSGGDLEDDETLLLAQKAALQKVSLEWIENTSGIDDALKSLDDLAAPLNALAGWAKSNLDDLRAALPLAEKDLKGVYQEVIGTIEKFEQPIQVLLQEVALTTEHLKRTQSWLPALQKADLIP